MGYRDGLRSHIPTSLARMGASCLIQRRRISDLYLERACHERYRATELWRRRWDLNPRKVSLHTISNRADSAALALLLKSDTHSFEMNTGSQGYPRRIEDLSDSLFNAEVQSSGRVPCDDRL